jgi:peptidoglycan-associated lipoprotein
MKSAKFLNLLVTAMVLSIAVVGCKRNPYGVTPLPPGAKTRPGDVKQSGPEELPPVAEGNKRAEGETIPIVTDPKIFDTWPQDREVLKAYTVHFDLDSSTVKSSEKSKVEAVADYLKQHPADALKIEGYCDERGTEEYNRSLGERRALALREYLANLGGNPDRIVTVSFGEERPVDPGHNEAAWAKNRRGEFILLTPPK